MRKCCVLAARDLFPLKTYWTVTSKSRGFFLFWATLIVPVRASPSQIARVSSKYMTVCFQCVGLALGPEDKPCIHSVRVECCNWINLKQSDRVLKTQIGNWIELTHLLRTQSSYGTLKTWRQSRQPKHVWNRFEWPLIWREPRRKHPQCSSCQCPLSDSQETSHRINSNSAVSRGEEWLLITPETSR